MKAVLRNRCIRPTPSPEWKDPAQPVLRNQFMKNLQRGME